MRRKQILRKVIPIIVIGILIFSTTRIIVILEGLKDTAGKDYTQVFLSAVDFEITFALSLFVYLQTERYNAFQRSQHQPILCFNKCVDSPCSDFLGTVYRDDRKGISLFKSFTTASTPLLISKLSCGETGKPNSDVKINLLLCFQQRGVSSIDKITICLETIPESLPDSADQSLLSNLSHRLKRGNTVRRWNIRRHPIYYCFKECEDFVWQFYFCGLPEAGFRDCRTLIIRLDITVTDTASYTHRLKNECIYEIFDGEPVLATVRSR